MSKTRSNRSKSIALLLALVLSGGTLTRNAQAAKRVSDAELAKAKGSAGYYSGVCTSDNAPCNLHACDFCIGDGCGVPGQENQNGNDNNAEYKDVDAGTYNYCNGGVKTTGVATCARDHAPAPTKISTVNRELYTNAGQLHAKCTWPSFASYPLCVKPNCVNGVFTLP